MTPRSNPSSTPRTLPHPHARPLARRPRCSTLVACLAPVATLAPLALAQPYSFRQVTTLGSGFGVFEPSLSADGSRVAFRTTADLTGQNPDGNFEIFLFDTSTSAFTQLTNTPNGVGNFVPMITPDGSKVVFRSAFDFTGQGQSAGTFQLWEVDVATNAFRQVTFHPANTPVFDPRMSKDGRFLVYNARINPTGQNADGSLEVFRVDRLSSQTIQISSNATLATQFPDINADGSVIVWGGRENYDGTNTNGGLEIWKWSEATGQITSVTNQAASLSETNLPRVDAAGRFVAFVSLFDFSGNNAIGRKILVADTQTGQIRLVTSRGVGGSGADYPDLAIAPDASAIYFESNIDLDGSNPDGNRELFRYDIPLNSVAALTHTTGGISIVALSDDATRRAIDVASNNSIAYRSDQDLDPSLSNNLANLDLFLGTLPASCTPDVNADGVSDQGDVDYLIDVIAGGPNPTNINPDFNRDGVSDQGDVDALINVVAGAPCP